MKSLEVGDKVWYVPADSRHKNPKGTYLEVRKVGRKYIYIEDMKVEQRDCNGFSIGLVVEWPYGTIYQSQEDYQEYSRWFNIQREIDRINLTREQKRDIMKIVGDSLT